MSDDLLTIAPTAFEAITAALPLGSVGYENSVNEDSQRDVWLDPGVVDRLGACAGRARATAT